MDKYGVYAKDDDEIHVMNQEEVFRYLSDKCDVFQTYSVHTDGVTVIVSEPSAGANGKLSEVTVGEFFSSFDEEGYTIRKISDFELARSAPESTALPSVAAAVEPFLILTEEELSKISEHNEKFVNGNNESVDALLASHRSLNTRNHNLVLENDELMAEVELLKQLIFDLDKFIDFSEPLTAGELIEFKDVTGINQVYKKVYRIVNPAQAALNEAMEEHNHE